MNQAADDLTTCRSAALDGVRVIELGGGISAPFCGKLLADYGACVTKVETPCSGDIARQWGPFPADQAHLEKSGTYFVLNTNKRSVTLDVSTPQGRDLFLKLLANADVLIENNRPADMRKWGLDYATIGPMFPNLVMISITPYGQTGPYADWLGYDLNAFHLTGAGSRYCGRPDEAPLEHGTFSAEYFGAFTGATWGLAALFGRDIVGGGQQIDVACAEVVGALFTGGQCIGAHAMTGAIDKRAGVGMRLTAPGNIMPCKDGYAWIIALETGQWRGLVRAMGNPEWAQLEMFDDFTVRGENADLIYAMVGEWAMNLTKQEVMDRLQAEGVPATAAYTAEDVANLPHLKERGYFRELEHQFLGRLRTFGPPVNMPESPGGARQPAPLLGEHNATVFENELKLSSDDIARLARLGVI